MADRTRSQKQRDHEETATPASLRLSEIVIQPVMRNQHDHPMPLGQPTTIYGDENGTPIENAVAWLTNTLTAQSEMAAAQFVTPAAVDQEAAA
jgi:hypothetical protein